MATAVFPHLPRGPVSCFDIFSVQHASEQGSCQVPRELVGGWFSNRPHHLVSTNGVNRARLIPGAATQQHLALFCRTGEATTGAATGEATTGAGVGTPGAGRRTGTIGRTGLETPGPTPKNRPKGAHIVTLNLLCFFESYGPLLSYLSSCMSIWCPMPAVCLNLSIQLEKGGLNRLAEQ